MKKITKSVAEMGKKTAIKNAEVMCRWFGHQPKVPAKLLEIKSGK